MDRYFHERHNPFAALTVEHDYTTGQSPGYNSVDFEALRKTGFGLGLIYTALLLMVLFGILGGVLEVSALAPGGISQPLFMVLGVSAL